MRKLFIFLAAIIPVLSFSSLAHADWDDHHHKHWKHGNYKYNRGATLVYEEYPAYYYATAPSYQYVDEYVTVPPAIPQEVYYTSENDTDGDDYCREFTRNILIDGRKQKAYGTACREADGSWKIQNN